MCALYENCNEKNQIKSNLIAYVVSQLVAFCALTNTLNQKIRSVLLCKTWRWPTNIL